MWQLHKKPDNVSTENCCEYFGISCPSSFATKVKGARRTLKAKEGVDLDALVAAYGVCIVTAVRISRAQKKQCLK